MNKITDASTKLLEYQVKLLKKRVLDLKYDNCREGVFNLSNCFSFFNFTARKIVLDTAHALFIDNLRKDSNYLSKISASKFASNYVSFKTPWHVYGLDETAMSFLEEWSNKNCSNVDTLPMLFAYANDTVGTYTYLNKKDWVWAGRFCPSRIYDMFKSYSAQSTMNGNWAGDYDRPAIHFKPFKTIHLMQQNVSIRLRNNRSYNENALKLLESEKNNINSYLKLLNNSTKSISVLSDSSSCVSILELAFIKCIVHFVTEKTTKYYQGKDEYADTLYEDIDCECDAADDSDYECECDRDMCSFLDDFNISNRTTISLINKKGYIFD